MNPQLTFDDLSSDNPNVTPEYMLAVMEGAIKHGLPVESTLLSLRGYGRPYHWMPCVELHWGWSTWLYRLSPSCRAAWEAAYLTKTVTREERQTIDQLKDLGVSLNETARGMRETTEVIRRITEAKPPERPFAVGDWVYHAGTDQPYQVAEIKHFVAPLMTCLRFDGYGALVFPHNCRHATPAEVAAHLGAQLASGHNPHRLTNWHVCPEMGWRLLDRDEVKPRGEPVGASWVRDPDYIECWHQDTPPLGWHRIGSGTGWDISTYRTRLSRAELAALDTPPATPKPLPPPYHDVPGLDPIGPGDYVIFKTDISLNGTSTLAHRKGDVHRVVKRTRSPFAVSDKTWKQGTIELEGLGIIHPAWVERVTSLKTVPLTMEDLPDGAFWVGFSDPLCPSGTGYLVTEIVPTGIRATCFDQRVTWDYLLKRDYRWSTNRKTWRPFSKQVLV